jgi:phage-related protein
MANAKQGMKPLYWVASSKKDMQALPRDVNEQMGFALREIRKGKTPIIAKTMQGFGGALVQELRANDSQGNTYRTVYTAKLSSGVYVLHAFQKKSTKGIKTPKKEIDKVNQRLKFAKQQHNELSRKGKKNVKKRGNRNTR